MINMWACGTSMVIFLAALQTVPRDFYEAATMDGANGWHKFWFITIPMTSPVILYNLIIAFIWGFQDFTLPMLLTGGGPNQSTLMYSMYLYNNAFVYLRMGQSFGPGLDPVRYYLVVYLGPLPFIPKMGVL